MTTATKPRTVTLTRGDENAAKTGWFVGSRKGLETWCYSPKTADFVQMCKNFDAAK